MTGISGNSNKPSSSSSSSTFSSSVASSSIIGTASQPPNTASSPASVSKVRVGIRVRPLAASERSQGGKSILNISAGTNSIGIGSKNFTYDAVFTSEITQQNLYNSVNGPLLNAILDGYNATIIAYGQTGSGKTYTMGSESLQTDSSADTSTHGLIPRFLADIFSSTKARTTNTDTPDNRTPHTEDSPDINNKQQQIKTTFQVSASFLEVYGEAIHDLLDFDTDSETGRKALSLREDMSGEITVAGLKEISVSSPQDALDVLRQGTLHRTTAATLMNHSSSRSHAVFTINLQKTELQGNKLGNSSSGSKPIHTKSRITFVDLAGSERMKRTGAEGERAREGIKINEGLLALGNVINALADEERLAKGEKVYVPYRQSKLTRLLQDALGGNSQTLILACVSPSNTNASETHSTLQYANRARNIKNKLVKNVDPVTSELRKLAAINNVLLTELVKHRYPAVDGPTEELIKRPEIKDYLNELFQQIPNNSNNENGNALSFSNTHHNGFHSSISSAPERMDIDVTPLNMQASANRNEQTTHDDNDMNKTFFDIDSNEDMAIINQLIELQTTHESSKPNSSSDQASDEIEQLTTATAQVENELVEQEGLLLQLRENLKLYHNMKEKYEVLMSDVQNLELEKSALAKELASVQIDPSKGCSIAIRKKLEKVETNLARTRTETKKYQQLYKKADNEARKCQALERKITELKRSKVSLFKKQKEETAKHREHNEKKTKEIKLLKKKERKAEIQVTKLETECRAYKLNLKKRKNYCLKLSEKLKETEAHLFKVMNNKKKHKVTNGSKSKNRAGESEKSSNNSNEAETNPFAPKTDETESISFLLDRMVADRVNQSIVRQEYELKLTQYKDLMSYLVKKVTLLGELQKKLSDKKVVENSEEERKEYKKQIEECEQSIEECELKVELTNTELEELRMQLPQDYQGEIDQDNNNEDDTGAVPSSKTENDAMKMVSNLNAALTRSLLWEFLDKYSNSQTQIKHLTNSIERKDSALQGCENEIDSLNEKIKSLSNDFDLRKSASRMADDQGVEQFHRMKKLTYELESVKKELQNSVANLEKSQKNEEELRSSVKKYEAETAKLKHELTIIQVAKECSSPSEEVREKLKNLQDEWDKIGLSPSAHEKTRSEIGRCLEDTCSRKLMETRRVSSGIQLEIDILFEQLQRICREMGSEDVIEKAKSMKVDNMTLMEQKNALRDTLQKIHPTYDASCERIKTLSSDLASLMNSLELEQDADIVRESIKQLLTYQLRPASSNHKDEQLDDSKMLKRRNAQSKRAQMMENVASMVEAISPLEENEDNMIIDPPNENFNNSSEQLVKRSDEYPPGSLSPSFLESCEKEIKKLRLFKSETLVRHSQKMDSIRGFIKDLHMPMSELDITLRKHIEKPKTWDTSIVETLSRNIYNPDLPVGVSSSIGKHLNVIHDLLRLIGINRGDVVQKLKTLVENIHNELLGAVDNAYDVSEATTSFHQALASLPPLSKELIQAYTDEINVLENTCEAVSDCEIDSLTTIWEASSTPESHRTSFLNDLTKAPVPDESESQSENLPWDPTFSTPLIEEWILSSINITSITQEKLGRSLQKLRRIRDEVEKLRKKQDIKGKILSLDSEIQVISGHLAEFEEKANNKSRLLTKKASSSGFLKEERFRKQMQGKFASKLKSMGSLLEEWKKSVGSEFDSSSLSEDVRAVLENAGTEDLNTWIKQRTAFMHLKTTTSTTTSKRSTEAVKKTPSSNKTYQVPSSLRKKRYISPSTEQRPRTRQAERSTTPPCLNSRASFQEKTSNNLDTPPSKQRKLSSDTNPLTKSSGTVSSKRRPPSSRQNERPKTRRLESHKKKRPVKTSPTERPTSPRTKTPIRNVGTSGKRASLLPFEHVLDSSAFMKENKPPSS